MGTNQSVPGDKPQNGMMGLIHWRYDLRSGFMIAMISLPFSMGIAITLGASRRCAGSPRPSSPASSCRSWADRTCTISGPAAGLAPVMFAGMIMLGSVQIGRGASQYELPHAGYGLVLVAICMAGGLQVVLARLKVARLSAIFPAAAIEGMLASIGLMIIAKQIPLFMGVKFDAHEFWAILREAPQHFATMNLQVLGLGVACLVTLFLLAAVPGRLLKVMPPPVWVFIFGTLASQLFLHMDHQHLINVPEVAAQTWGRAAELRRGVHQLPLVGAVGVHRRHPAIDRRDRVPGHNHRRGQTRPLSSPVRPRPHTPRDGRLQRVREPGRQA